MLFISLFVFVGKQTRFLWDTEGILLEKIHQKGGVKLLPEDFIIDQNVAKSTKGLVVTSENYHFFYRDMKWDDAAGLRFASLVCKNQMPHDVGFPLICQNHPTYFSAKDFTYESFPFLLKGNLAASSIHAGAVRLKLNDAEMAFYPWGYEAKGSLKEIIDFSLRKLPCGLYWESSQGSMTSGKGIFLTKIQIKDLLFDDGRGEVTINLYVNIEQGKMWGAASTENGQVGLSLGLMSSSLRIEEVQPQYRLMGRINEEGEEWLYHRTAEGIDDQLRTLMGDNLTNEMGQEKIFELTRKKDSKAFTVKGLTQGWAWKGQR